ncbi:hypothetical protein [Halorubrum sp. Atlit-26R]|uniref:hypothetical protein n=1 Tax=Halorubrum sp. Atlit-26R TaxID=2282128 RepID=UPI000EF1903F|nr:hypothetical protein [Halorubrum sp. Atlit-26R]RLM62990.1 hypothetical protein DVK07_17155 [Halorubrum sp. Atlit-26R]
MGIIESVVDRTEYRDTFERVDTRISAWMRRWSVPIVRTAIGVVFIWFGALKVIGISPAGELVARTVYFFPPEVFVPVLGVWEVLIGLFFLSRPLIRLAILLLFIQLPGTFLPIVLLPDVVFTTFPYGLTVEGQYIVKNLVIIGAALVIGGSLSEDESPASDS